MLDDVTHLGWERADRTSTNPFATALTRKCQGGAWASRRLELYRVLIVILRSSLKIAVAKPCSVLFPRIWEWVGAVRRICRAYHAAHGFYPSLISPVRYTEKIQWRKLL
jgi:hypothetical protein